MEASLINGDGKFDNIREQVVGNEARILMASIADSPEEEIATGFPYKDAAGQADFHVVREGIIEDVDYSDPNNPTIRAIDRRSDWSQKISPNLMTVAEYANLEDKNINKRKPLIIGQVSGTECIRLEPKPGSSTNTDFLICDTSVGSISTVTDIYFDGKISGSDVDRVLTGGEYSVNLNTGILTVNNYDTGNAYFYGNVTTLTETVEITLFLLDEYANFAYIPSNFNKNEIENIRALDYETHVYINKSGKELFKVIERLMMDIQVDFFQQGSILTMRKSNEERASVEDVPLYQITDNPAGWVSDRTDTVKTISVSYDQDYRLKSGTVYFDGSKEDDALDANLKAIDKPFETNLISESDIIEIYDEYYTRFTAPSRTVTVNRVVPFSAGLTDFVTFKVTRQNDIDGDTDVFPRGIYKIVSIDQNANTAEIIYFSDRPEPFYSQGTYAGAKNISIFEETTTLGGGSAVYVDPSYLFVSSPPYVDISSGYTQFPSRTPAYAFGAPDSNANNTPFDGFVSFRVAAFRTPAGSGGIASTSSFIEGSGNVSGQTQQAGE